MEKGKSTVKWLIILMVILFEKMNYAQTYFSFPVTTGRLVHEWHDEFGNPTGMMDVISIGGDTTIGTYSYKKIYSGAIRESNKVIYFYSFQDSAEYLLYDFSKQAGDTVYRAYYNYASSGRHYIDTLIISQVDSTQPLADGNPHKRWNFINNCGQWIEGIGNFTHLLSPLYTCPLSGGWVLNCFINDSGLVYQYNGWGAGCITGVEDLNSGNRSVKIFPNPGNDLINIEKNFADDRNSFFRISNCEGKTIHEMNEIPAKINVADLEKGVYFITVRNNVISETSRFVKY